MIESGLILNKIGTDVLSTTMSVPEICGVTSRIWGRSLSVPECNAGSISSRPLRGHVAHMGESRNAYRVLVGRLEGKRPLERPRRRWEDNIKMDLREVGYDGTKRRPECGADYITPLPRTRMHGSAIAMPSYALRRHGYLYLSFTPISPGGWLGRYLERETDNDIKSVGEETRQLVKTAGRDGEFERLRSGMASSDEIPWLLAVLICSECSGFIAYVMDNNRPLTIKVSKTKKCVENRKLRQQEKPYTTARERICKAMVPDEMQDIVRSSRIKKSFKVISMKSEDFLDVASEPVRALNMVTLRITQVSWIRVACDHH
ncbi:hypothetical protein ANN_18839 [Periplaneta americana]|uniref:Uncharacterized protein n=1 Tax=Periplaneta americana TaxID=6978 RepID=A0ABQ8SPV8_PERAM|nr:hypothetical protein ANN_18839 [Periplaneta americana]